MKVERRWNWPKIRGKSTSRDNSRVNSCSGWKSSNPSSSCSTHRSTRSSKMSHSHPLSFAFQLPLGLRQIGVLPIFHGLWLLFQYFLSILAFLPHMGELLSFDWGVFYPRFWSLYLVSSDIRLSLIWSYDLFWMVNYMHSKQVITSNNILSLIWHSKLLIYQSEYDHKMTNKWPFWLAHFCRQKRMNWHQQSHAAS